MLKKTQGDIKSIVTLKSKNKIAPNLLIVNENVITNTITSLRDSVGFFDNVSSNLASKTKDLLIHI